MRKNIEGINYVYGEDNFLRDINPKLSKKVRRMIGENNSEDIMARI